MQSSASLSMRALAAKIHHQLPLSPRESHRLLNLLTSSFRRQLDRHHPATSNSNHARARIPPNSLPQKQPCSVSSSLSSLDLANQHITNLLSHPILSVGNPATLGRTAASLLESDPVSWYKSQLSCGDTTLRTYKAALDQVWTTLKLESNTPRSRDRSSHSRSPTNPTAVITGWLAASRPNAVEELVQSKETANVVFSCLVVEGSDSTIWQWLCDPALHAKAVILLKYISALLSFRTIEVAAEAFIDATRRLSNRDNLVPAKRRLIAALIENRGQPISIATHEALTQTSAVWAWPQTFDLSVIALRHPITPDVRPALAYIKHLHAEASKSQGPALQSARPSTRRHILMICLETSNLLLEKARLQEAQFVMHFVQATFAQELGLAEVVAQEEGAVHKTEGALPSNRKMAARREKERENLLHLEELAVG